MVSAALSSETLMALAQGLYQQDPEAIGGSLVASALVSALPLATVFVLLGVFRLRAQWAALSGLAVALVVAGCAMPVGQALLAASRGAFTGSDTSANALFGSLQVTAANGAGLPPDLLAAANSSGGVLGKMLSPQNLTIACVAVKLEGQEGVLLRRVIGWSPGLDAAVTPDGVRQVQ